MSGSAITAAIYNRLTAASLGAPVYRNVPPPQAALPFVVILGASEGARPLTLDGSAMSVARTIQVAAARKADSADIDDLAEAVADALHTSPTAYIATGYSVERVSVDGPVDMDLDAEHYGRQVFLRLEVSKTS